MRYKRPDFNVLKKRDNCPSSEYNLLWYLDDYKVIEVEYNQQLYEGKKYLMPGEVLSNEYHQDNCIVKRLGDKWRVIQELRDIPDLDDRKRKYEEYYPDDNPNVKKTGNSYTSYKSKYKKKKGGSSNVNKNWSVRDNDVIYDLS